MKVGNRAKTEWIKYCKKKKGKSQKICGKRYHSFQKSSRVCPDCKAETKRNRVLKGY